MEGEQKRVGRKVGIDPVSEPLLGRRLFKDEKGGKEGGGEERRLDRAKGRLKEGVSGGIEGFPQGRKLEGSQVSWSEWCFWLRRALDVGQVGRSRLHTRIGSSACASASSPKQDGRERLTMAALSWSRLSPGWIQ